MLKRFIAYFRPHRKMLVMDLLASLMISVIGMVYPVITRNMLNTYIPEKMYTTIVIAGLVVLALYAVRMLLRFFVQYYGHLIGVGCRARCGETCSPTWRSCPSRTTTTTRPAA